LKVFLWVEHDQTVEKKKSNKKKVKKSKNFYIKSLNQGCENIRYYRMFYAALEI